MHASPTITAVLPNALLPLGLELNGQLFRHFQIRTRCETSPRQYSKINSVVINNSLLGALLPHAPK